MVEKAATISVKRRKNCRDNYQLSLVQSDIEFLGLDDDRKITKIYDDKNNVIIIKARKEQF